MANAPLLRKLNRAERALRPQNTAKQIDEIRSKVDEIIVALANLNTNVTGSAGGTSLAIAHGPWTGSYSTASADGIVDKYLRTDTILKYPPALGTPTRVVTLSNDGTEGALLTADNSFAVNGFAIKAPNATNTLRIGKWGNIAVGGGVALSDNYLISFNKQNFSDATEDVGYTGSLRQQGTGGVCGFRLTADLGGTSANTNRLLGIDLITKQTTTNTTGEQVCCALLYTSTTLAGVSRGDQKGIRINAGPFASVTYTNHYGIQMQKPTSNNWGTVTNNYWVYMEALTGGTNRYGLWMDGITTGTPTVSTGINIETHTVGTTRRAVRGGNTFECTANDFLASTAAKGLVTKDTQGTARYWRIYNEATGTASVGGNFGMTAKGHVYWLRGASPGGEVQMWINDVGTTAPTT